MKKAKVPNYKEHNDFESLALPFQRRLYRTALILTKSPRHAEELLQATNLSAKKDYHLIEAGIEFDFSVWLSELLIKIYMATCEDLNCKKAALAILDS